ncbi:MAG: Fic family protein [Polyangiaceae bacterium]|nr:Fic family protein [Polyangiaceae bacterium]
MKLRKATPSSVKVKAAPAVQLPPPPPKPKTMDERRAAAEARLSKSDDAFIQGYLQRLDMSWIFHDAALEGTVYTKEELALALSNAVLPAPVEGESTMQPICDEIRRHRAAINFVREMAVKRKATLTVDTIRQIYLILHPEEGDLKSVKFRKDVPQHRLYFHEYAAPDRIAPKVRAVVDWVNDPETRKTRSPLRLAARAHYDLVRVFPFAADSGKVARLFMNILILRAGYPPAIIHSADRQRYYDGLKGAPVAINQMVTESIDNALSSVEKLLDERDTRTRSFV